MALENGLVLCAEDGERVEEFLSPEGSAVAVRADITSLACPDERIIEPYGTLPVEIGGGISNDLIKIANKNDYQDRRHLSSRYAQPLLSFAGQLQTNGSSGGSHRLTFDNRGKHTFIVPADEELELATQYVLNDRTIPESELVARVNKMQELNTNNGTDIGLIYEQNGQPLLGIKMEKILLPHLVGKVLTLGKTFPHGPHREKLHRLLEITEHDNGEIDERHSDPRHNALMQTGGAITYINGGGIVMHEAVIVEKVNGKLNVVKNSPVAKHGPSDLGQGRPHIEGDGFPRHALIGEFEGNVVDLHRAMQEGYSVYMKATPIKLGWVEHNGKFNAQSV